MTFKEWQEAMSTVLLPTSLVVAVLAAVGYTIYRINHRRLLPGQVMFLIGFSALGTTTGFAAGHSREAVLGAVLPALLALVSSLLAYLFTKDGLVEYRPVIPYCITVLVFGGLSGLSLGSTLRGRFERHEREYARAMLRYEHVELEYEKAKHLAELEIWKRQSIAELDKESAEAGSREESLPNPAAPADPKASLSGR